jgi:hypothetical protein
VLKVRAGARLGAAVSLPEDAQVTLRAGEDLELDLVREADDEVGWVERETGCGPRDIAKVHRIGRMPLMPPGRCFRGRGEAKGEVCATLSGLFAMSVTPAAETEAPLTESPRPPGGSGRPPRVRSGW